MRAVCEVCSQPAQLRRYTRYSWIQSGVLIRGVASDWKELGRYGRCLSTAFKANMLKACFTGGHGRYRDAAMDLIKIYGNDDGDSSKKHVRGRGYTA
jgi:hypothetical protein